MQVRQGKVHDGEKIMVFVLESIMKLLESYEITEVKSVGALLGEVIPDNVMELLPVLKLPLMFSTFPLAEQLPV